MLDSLIMPITKKTVYTILVLEVQIPKDRVTFNDLIQDIEVQGKFVYALNLLDKLPTNGTTYSEVMVEHLQTLCVTVS